MCSGVSSYVVQAVAFACSHKQIQHTKTSTRRHKSIVLIAAFIRRLSMISFFAAVIITQTQRVRKGEERKTDIERGRGGENKGEGVKKDKVKSKKVVKVLDGFSSRGSQKREKQIKRQLGVIIRDEEIRRHRWKQTVEILFIARSISLFSY